MLRDPLTLPIISEVDGTISFNDLTEDVTMNVDVDDLTGASTREVIDVNERPLKRERNDTIHFCS